MRQLIGRISILMLAVVAGFAAASGASARGIAVDTTLPPIVTVCDLGSPCAASGLGGQYDFSNFFNDGSVTDTNFNAGIFNNLYIYNDGVVSFGAPLPTTASVAGGLASLGPNYIAPGLANLNSPQVYISAFPQEAADGSLFVNEVTISWVFKGPSDQLSLLGLDLVDKSAEGIAGAKPGDVSIDMDFGAGSTSWFGGLPNDFCDAQCQSDISSNDFGVEGVYLPSGAKIGTSQGCAGLPTTVGANFSYPGFFCSANINVASVAGAAPEPAAWALLLMGVGLIGFQLRAKRAASPKTASV